MNPQRSGSSAFRIPLAHCPTSHRRHTLCMGGFGTSHFALNPFVCRHDAPTFTRHLQLYIGQVHSKTIAPKYSIPRRRFLYPTQHLRPHFPNLESPPTAPISHLLPSSAFHQRSTLKPCLSMYFSTQRTVHTVVAHQHHRRTHSRTNGAPTPAASSNLPELPSSLQQPAYRCFTGV